MGSANHDTRQRRAVLLDSARSLQGETGVQGAALVHPELAHALAHALAEDMGRLVRLRTAAAGTLDELVDALVDAVVDGADAWRDGLVLANAGLERIVDYDVWSQTVGPWVEAIEDALRAAQARGLVRDDVDPGTTAVFLRDALDRTAKASVLFGRTGYRHTAAALVRAALRA